MKDLFVQVLKHSTQIQYVIGGLIGVVLFVAAVRYDQPQGGLQK